MYMDLAILEKRYLRIPTWYAKLVGIWPFLSDHRKQIQYICISIMVIYAVITQLARVVVFWSISVLTEQIPFIVVPIISGTKYYNYAGHCDTFKDLFESMLNDWRHEKTNEETKILERFADRAVIYILVYIANAYVVTVVFFMVPFQPYVWDKLMPLNESRPRIQMYDGYYFVKDQDKYYYFIMGYTIISLLTATSMFIASDTILVYVVQHCCGLLGLAGYRLRNCLVEWTSTENLTEKDRRRMYDKVNYAIKTHQRALVFLIEIENAFAMNLFVQIGISCLTFTLTLLVAANVKLSADTYQFYSYTIAQLIHILFLTIQGQFVINMHDSVYRKGYETPWYNADVRTQELFVLIHRRNLTPPLLTAGGLIELNMNSFAEIVKASVSYFTVLKSV